MKKLMVLAALALAGAAGGQNLPWQATENVLSARTSDKVYVVFHAPPANTALGGQVLWMATIDTRTANSYRMTCAEHVYAGRLSDSVVLQRTAYFTTQQRIDPFYNIIERALSENTPANFVAAAAVGCAVSPRQGLVSQTLYLVPGEEQPLAWDGPPVRVRVQVEAGGGLRITLPTP